MFFAFLTWFSFSKKDYATSSFYGANVEEGA